MQCYLRSAVPFGAVAFQVVLVDYIHAQLPWVAVTQASSPVVLHGPVREDVKESLKEGKSQE